jgi:hypothetical protein
MSVASLHAPNRPKKAHVESVGPGSLLSRICSREIEGYVRDLVRGCVAVRQDECLYHGLTQFSCYVVRQDAHEACYEIRTRKYLCCDAYRISVDFGVLLPYPRLGPERFFTHVLTALCGTSLRSGRGSLRLGFALLSATASNAARSALMSPRWPPSRSSMMKSLALAAPGFRCVGVCSMS